MILNTELIIEQIKFHTLIHYFLPDLKHTSVGKHSEPGGPLGKILFFPSKSRP